MQLAIFKRHTFHHLLQHQKPNRYDLSFADFADQEFQYLTTLYLEHTIELNLSYNQICLKFCIKPNTIRWQSLQNLNLNNNLIEGKGVKWLLQVEMKQLDTLSLSNNQINDNSLKYLSKNRWKKLKIANLAHNKITDKGMKFLLRFDWKCLKSLFIQQNWIDIEGKKSLLLADWSNLSKIYCYHEHLTNCTQTLKMKQFGLIQNMLANKFGQKCQIHL